MNGVTKNTTDFTVTTTGDAFISQRKLAELCGVDQSTISLRCSSLKLDVKQGVSAENAFLLITYYATESKAANDAARKTLAKVGAAGMKAFIYIEAGYKLGVTNANSLADIFAAQRIVCEMLRLPESGTLKLLGDLNARHGNPVSLPAYGVDDSAVSTRGSSDVTFFATHLLKKYNIDMSVHKFNILVEGVGYLKTLTRPSTTKGTKHYKAVTETGLVYGKNITSPSNPRETQPHWFENKFLELVSILEMI